MKKSNKQSRLVRVWASVVAGLTTLSVIGVALSYPTAKHVDVAKRMNAGPEEAELMNLMSSPETAWTTAVGLIAMLITLVAFVVGIYFTYRYIRRHRLSTNAAGLTAGIFTVGGIVSGLVGQLISTAYGIVPVLMSSPVWVIVLTLINAVMTFILAFIITLVVQHFYDRKHSFAIE